MISHVQTILNEVKVLVEYISDSEYVAPTPLHTPKTLETCKKSTLLIHVFYLSVSVKHKDLTRKSCVFIFYFIVSVVKIVCLYFFYIEDDRLKKNLKKTWMMELSFFWCLYLSFFIKKGTLAQLFSCEFCEFSKNTFLTELLWAASSDF